MEQMMGVKEPLPDALAAEIAGADQPRPRRSTRCLLVRTVVGLHRRIT